MRPSRSGDTVVCILNWRHEYARIAARALREEGHDVFLFENDEMKASDMEGVRLFRSDVNVGNSRSRNVMIREALDSGYEYIGLLDGDIVPPLNMFSAFRMFMKTIEGVHTVYRHHVERLSVEDLREEGASSFVDEMPFGYVFPSQCSLNKREVFEALLFPEEDPFDGPGWGGEDDVLGIMARHVVPGYRCVNSKGTLYAHDLNHSVKKGIVCRDFFDRSVRRLVYSRCFRACSPEQQVAWWRDGKIPKMMVSADVLPIFSTWTPEIIASPGRTISMDESDLTRPRLYTYLRKLDEAVADAAIRPNPFL